MQREFFPGLAVKAMRMRLLAAFALALAVPLCAGSLQANAVVYSSYGPGLSTDGDWYSGGPYFGTTFSPSSTVKLSSIIGQWSYYPETVTISLWSDSSGQPGTELESWSLAIDDTAEFNTSFNYTLVSTSSPQLVAGDTYWVLVQAPPDSQGLAFVFWNAYSGAPLGGIWGGYSPTTLIQDFSSDSVPALQVVGTTPEPSSLFLLSFGLVGLWLVVRKRKALVAERELIRAGASYR